MTDAQSAALERGLEVPGGAARLASWLSQPRDIAALAVFRMAFGLLVAVSSLRFLAYGWVDELFVRPTFQFKYWGFGWVPTLVGPGMKLVFVALVVLGLCVSAGLFYRAAIALLFLTFTYVQLVDVTNYLNHYYLVSLLAGLLFFIPAHRAWSLDVLRRPSLRRSTLPAWCTTLLRFQVAVVYVFAGLAKLTSDWLLHAQPLNIWLSARTDWPLVGPLMDQRAVAFSAAWLGFLFDTSVVFFLSIRRTRRFAYAAVIAFHAATAALFPIGMFPAIMMVAASVFFDPSWPRRVGARLFGARSQATLGLTIGTPRCVGAQTKLALLMAGSYAALQLLVPLRGHLYGGNVHWHEQGMRFSWRVMTREKNGSVSFTVRDPRTGRRWLVSPSEYLTPLQEREMSGQPDLILQLARRIGRDFAERNHGPVEVRAEARVSLNGRPAADLIDPSVDLAAAVDGLGRKPWISPAPTTGPIHLRGLAWRVDHRDEGELR